MTLSSQEFPDVTFRMDNIVRIGGEVIFTTHDGTCAWKLNRTNPGLMPGVPVPPVVYGDIEGPWVNGKLGGNDRAYGRWNVADGTMTFGGRSLDPSVRR